MNLTGEPLLALTVLLSLTCPVALALVWRRRARSNSWIAALQHLVGLILCQVIAMAALFVWVNDQYGFYNSWSDLVGVSGTPAKISANGLVRSGDGRTELLTVAGGTASPTRQILVWLPPQYDQPSNAGQRYPVIMVLPGQPSNPQAMFRHYDFAQAATDQIRAGRARPFIAVFPPLMTNPPRDTECTDIPHGPQAETWLSSDVFTAVRQQLRVAPHQWAIAGWSTGAFCAAKLLLRHPDLYTAAAGFGGYYTAITDHTTGNLFGSDRAAQQRNSPIWLYRHGGLHGRKLLLVVGRQDHESWAPTEAILRASRGDPDVSALVFPIGGHNYRNYRRYLPDALLWLDALLTTR